MAIDRAPWAALVDDDGSNLVGTVWNKAAIAASLLDPIDTTVAMHSIANADTGTLHNWAPAGLQVPAHILWNGSATTLVTGLAGGRHGQIVIIKNNGPAGLSFASYSTASVAANRIVTMATSAPTPIAPGGSVELIYHNDVWILLAHEQGAPIAVPFSAANYASQGSITSGMVKRHDYYVRGRTLTGTVAIEGLPGNTASDSFFISGWGFTQTGAVCIAPGIGTINGPWGAILGVINTTAVNIQRFDFGNWTAGPHTIHWQATWTVT